MVPALKAYHRPVFEDPSEVVAFVQYQLLLTSVASLLYYDYVITLHTEIRLVWCAPLSSGKLFFLLIRYGFIVDVSLVLFYTVRLTSSSGLILTAMSCQALYTSATTIQLLNFAFVSGTYSHDRYRVMTALGIFNVVSASVISSWSTQLPDDINAVLGRVLVPILTTRFIINLRQSGGELYSTNSPSGAHVSLPALSFLSRSDGMFGPLGGDVDDPLNIP
ncbi:hypothetical protein C8Q78DRAFT_973091 [Trametes maxima]|nr:hypothetical protein C8Q78DRAFT_973091 [Trametes maxima]